MARLICAAVRSTGVAAVRAASCNWISARLYITAGSRSGIVSTAFCTGTLTVRALAPVTSSASDAPGFAAPTAARRSATDATAVPPALTMTSPAARPLATTRCEMLWRSASTSTGAKPVPLRR